MLAEHHEVGQCEEAGVEVVARRGGEEALAIVGEEIQEEVLGEGALVPVEAEVEIPTLPGQLAGGARSQRSMAFGRIYGN